MRPFHPLAPALRPFGVGLSDASVRVEPQTVAYSARARFIFIWVTLNCEKSFVTAGAELYLNHFAELEYAV